MTYLAFFSAFGIDENGMYDEEQVLATFEEVQSLFQVFQTY